MEYFYKKLPLNTLHKINKFAYIEQVLERKRKPSKHKIFPYQALEYCIFKQKRVPQLEEIILTHSTIRSGYLKLLKLIKD